MATNKNAFSRYRFLDELLSNRYKNFSLDDLTEEVNLRLSELHTNNDGVTRRCIEKDIQYLEHNSPFQVELERYSVSSFNPETQKTFTKRCLRYKDGCFSIFKKRFNREEEYLLKEVLRLLGQFEGLPNLGSLEQLRKSFMIKKEEKQIISFTKNPIEYRSTLAQLFIAISQQQTIRLTYKKFEHHSEAKLVDVYPYLLKEYCGRWYLFASKCSETRVVCYALDRILDIEPLKANKYIPYNGNLNERFEDIIGITFFEDKPVEHILFWVSDRELNYVLTKPLHESQKFYTNENHEKLQKQYPKCQGGAFFSIDCIRNYELIRELCSYGGDLLVLSPQSLQKEIFEKISTMQNEYEKIL